MFIDRNLSLELLDVPYILQLLGLWIAGAYLIIDKGVIFYEWSLTFYTKMRSETHALLIFRKKKWYLVKDKRELKLLNYAFFLVWACASLFIKE